MIPAHRRRHAAALGLAGLAALPVAFAPLPVMADLPNHVARHHVLAQAVFGAGNPHWSVAWRWIGNLGVDLPAVLLTPWLGAEAATRLVVLAIAPLTVLGLLALGRAAHGRITPGIALALPFAFAKPWHYGFVNSCLSVALALLVAAAWLRRPADTRWRAAGFAAAALGVWSAHVAGWAVLLLIVAGTELARAGTWRQLPGRALRAAPLLLPVVPLLLWRGSGAGPAFVGSPQPVWDKVLNVATMLKGLSLPFDLAMLGLLGGLAAIALALARPPRVEPRLGAGAVLLGLAFLAMPATVLGSWGADLRLAPVAAMVALAAIAPPRSDRWAMPLVAAGITLFAARAAVATAMWHAAQPGLERRLVLLDRVPRGGRLGFVIARPDCRTPWAFTLDSKLASLAVVRRDAFANTMFRIPGADLIAVRRPADALWFDGSQAVACADGHHGFEARLAAMTAARFDAIWIADAATMPPVPRGYRIAARTPRDLLLRRAGEGGLE